MDPNANCYFCQILEFKRSFTQDRTALGGITGGFIKMTCDWSKITSTEPRDNILLGWFKYNTRRKKVEVKSSDRVLFMHYTGKYC